MIETETIEALSDKQANVEIVRKNKTEHVFIPGFGQIIRSINHTGGHLSFILWHMKLAPFLVITAFRDGNTLEENRELNNALLDDYRSKSLGGLKFRGHYLELEYDENHHPIGEAKPVDEEIFFLSLHTRKTLSDVGDLANFGRQMCKKYHQDVIYSNGESVYFFYQNGRQIRVGTISELTEDLFVEYWSRLRGKKFMPEGYAQPYSSIQAMMMGKHCLYDYLKRYEPQQDQDKTAKD